MFPLHELNTSSIKKTGGTVYVTLSRGSCRGVNMCVSFRDASFCKKYATMTLPRVLRHRVNLCARFYGDERNPVQPFMMSSGHVSAHEIVCILLHLRSFYVQSYLIFSHYTSSQKSCAIASLKCLLALLLTTIF